MAEKEDLLKDLKIDRSKSAEEKSIQSNKFLLFGLATIIILFFGWFFLSEDQAKIVTTFTVKSLNTNDSSASSILDASGYVVARRRATVSSKITGKVMKVFVEGERDGQKLRHSFDLVDHYDPKTETHSMARTTGYTATMAIRLLAEGLYTEKGVIPPELIGQHKECVDFMLAGLRERGVVYQESVEILD